MPQALKSLLALILQIGPKSGVLNLDYFSRMNIGRNEGRGLRGWTLVVQYTRTDNQLSQGADPRVRPVDCAGVWACGSAGDGRERRTKPGRRLAQITTSPFGLRKSVSSFPVICVHRFVIRRVNGRMVSAGCAAEATAGILGARTAARLMH